MESRGAKGVVTERPQILTRHHRAVAAIVAAGMPCERPAPADHLSAEDLLRDRECVLTVYYDPGEGNVTHEEGNVITPGNLDRFVAVVRDRDGNELAAGDASDSIAEALLRLSEPSAPLPEPLPDPFSVQSGNPFLEPFDQALF